MIASVDPKICIGCTLCTQTCPGVFKMENDKSVACINPVPDGLKEACEKAAEDCPVGAITIDNI